jgi:diaminohydroxyphosphoribosylaminopyrimidine deaminase/5-amino-6-(5-phosphoribosylamino)uracil reductase
LPSSPDLQLTIGFGQSLDGRIATANGDAKWISGPAALRIAHELRAEHDAIMVGVGTVLNDDPALTCRLPDPLLSTADPLRSPLRVILDSRLRLPLSAQVAERQLPASTLLLTTDAADPQRAAALLAAGVEVLAVAADATGRVALSAVWTALRARQIRSVYIEGGSDLLTSVVASGAALEAVVFVAPRLIGNTGRPALGAALASRVAAAPRGRTVSAALVGADIVWRLQFPARV